MIIDQVQLHPLDFRLSWCTRMDRHSQERLGIHSDSDQDKVAAEGEWMNYWIQLHSKFNYKSNKWPNISKYFNAGILTDRENYSWNSSLYSLIIAFSLYLTSTSNFRTEAGKRKGLKFFTVEKVLRHLSSK